MLSDLRKFLRLTVRIKPMLKGLFYRQDFVDVYQQIFFVDKDLLKARIPNLKERVLKSASNLFMKFLIQAVGYITFSQTNFVRHKAKGLAPE